ncbi:hypothetical protein SAMN06296065_102158 [Novosphingobium panipatense]|uniref:Uncharacterized protein n=1 Tax=Novosphingobium panipatense TaxID=428991 RepID=A0ABY1Q3V2_9SPHN|nr:hypothetical protein SAMN06296065_102158 [Novosphingobium panipatense]
MCAQSDRGSTGSLIVGTIMAAEAHFGRSETLLNAAVRLSPLPR